MTDLLLIKEKLWQGKVNIDILFHDGTPQVKEYLLICHRVSYLPIYFDRIIKYFENFTAIEQPVWLEYNNIPIKWNLPVGVIYDYYHIPNRDTETKLTLTLRYGTKEWPTDIIPFYYKGAIDYERALSDNYFNQLKQSSFVMTGNSKLVMNLSKENSTDLWHAIKSHNLHDYTTINRKLLPKKINRVPIKIYIVGSPIIQLPVFTGTLGALLQKYPGFEAYIHGINAEHVLEIDLDDLWSTFRYLDNFLYIVLI